MDNRFIRVDEVAAELDVSKPYAYKPISRRCIISSAQFSIMRFDSMISAQIRQPKPGIWATKSERKCCSGQRKSI